MFAKDRLTPISQLRKGVRSMTVRARVISKGAIKSFGQEKTFKIEIYDGTLPYSTLVFFSCSDCEGFFNAVQVNSIYKFSKGQIASDNQKNMTRNCIKYDIFDPSYIQLEAETEKDAITQNFNKFEFLKLNQITDKNITYHFDVLGVVLEQPSVDRQFEKGFHVETWKFLLGDESGKSVQVSLRKEFGLNLTGLRIFDVVLIKSTHVNQYGNMKTIDGGSGIFINPEITESYEILQNLDQLMTEGEMKHHSLPNNQQTSMFPTQNQIQSSTETTSKNTRGLEFEQLGDSRMSMHSYEVRSISSLVQQTDELLSRAIQLLQKSDNSSQDPIFQREFNRTIYSDIIASISSTGAEKKPFYLACSVCNKKIENDQKTCFKNCPNSVAIGKITTTFNLADSTGAISAVAFNEQAQEIFGFDGEFLRSLENLQKSDKLLRKDPNMKDFIRLSFNQSYRFRVLSGIQIYEKKYTTKYQILSCKQIETVGFNKDIMEQIEQHMARQIN